MIISWPFLFTPEDPENTTEARNNSYERPHGMYPVSYDLRWHGGCHLLGSYTTEPVRAIADGVLVAYRVAPDMVLWGDEKQKCHTSFALLKHTTETGAGRTLTFYSLYMHLHCINQEISFPQRQAIIAPLRTPTGPDAIADGHTKVYRKDILGYPGGMYGEGYLHFEIFMEDADFSAWFGAPHTSLGVAEPAARTDAQTDYWGNSYYLIPKGVPLRAAHPRQDAGHKVAGYLFPMLAGIEHTPCKLLVQVRYDRGDRKTTVWNAETGQRISGTEDGDKEPGYEYGLYARAVALYPICPSAGYELLRYGRILGPDRFPVNTPATALENWQPVEFAHGQRGYADFSASNIVKLSDADFAGATGWARVNGAMDGPQVNVTALSQIIKDADTNHDGTTTAEELEQWARQDPIRKKLRRMICRAPSEWDTANNGRYNYLLEQGAPMADDPARFKKRNDFVLKFQFWQVLGGMSSKVWHFHPLEFIAHFRKCGWLSEGELKQVLPMSAIRASKGEWVSEGVLFGKESKDVIQNNRLELNKALRKFGICSTPLRLAAFFGNATQETQWFSKLYENNPNQRYFPWDGRGFLQLTWPFNYIKYWRFRGRQVPEKLEAELKAAQNTSHANPAGMQDAQHQGLTAEMIGWRNQIETRDIDAANSAGAYWAWSGAAMYADRQPGMKRRTCLVKGKSMLFYESVPFGQVAATVNIGQPATDGKQINGVNGLIARCQAYTHALMVLAEGIVFPDAKGEKQDAPEGFTPRREK